MTEVLPVDRHRVAGAGGGWLWATGSASAAHCPAFASGSARSTPLVGLTARRCLPSRSPGRSAYQPDTSRTATTGCGQLSRPARVISGWHRTGDVGHLDAAGRLWVEGRLGSRDHQPPTDRSPRSEQNNESRPRRSVTGAALVGVGPQGTQQPVAVVVTSGTRARRTGGRETCPCRTGRRGYSPGCSADSASPFPSTSGTPRRSTGLASPAGPAECSAAPGWAVRKRVQRAGAGHGD